MKKRQNIYKLGAAYYPDYISAGETVTRRAQGGEIVRLSRSERVDEDFRRMVKQGIHTIRMGEFSWATVEPSPGEWRPDIFLRALDRAAESGIGVIFCTPTATPPKWLIDQQPDILPITRTGGTIPFGSRRHYDFHNQAYRAESIRITEAYGRFFGSHPAVVSWQTDNEFGCHNSIFLFTSAAREGFQKWLAERYDDDIEKLNEEWFTCFWSQRYRSFLEIDLPRASWTDQNPHMELDFRRFSNEAVCRFQREQIDVLRHWSPGRPITHNLMTLFTDLCPWQVSRDLDYVGFDHYQMEQEPHPTTSAWQFALMRSARQQHFAILEQQPVQVNWQPTNRRLSLDWLFVWGMQSAFQGANQMLYFSWQRMPGGCEQYHDGVVPHDVRIESSQQEKLIAAKNEIFGRLERELGLSEALPLPSRDVLCIHDTESLWSHEITAQSVVYSTRQQLDHVARFCLRFGFGLWFSPSIGAERHHLMRYKLIVLPGYAFELTEEERYLLIEFRRHGGRVLSFPRTGYKQRNNKLSPLPVFFYDQSDFYLEDYGAMLATERDSCVWADGSCDRGFEGHLWAEKIVILNQGWETKAIFSEGSLYGGAPAIMKLQEHPQYGAHVHVATCPVPTEEFLGCLRETLDLNAAAEAHSPELQLQVLRGEEGVFLTGVHTGHGATTLRINPGLPVRRIFQLGINSALEATISVGRTGGGTLEVPPRSAFIAEIQSGYRLTS
jgi:beta-galactosidase